MPGTCSRGSTGHSALLTPLSPAVPVAVTGSYGALSWPRASPCVSLHGCGGPSLRCLVLSQLFPGLPSRGRVLRQERLSVLPESCLPSPFSGKSPHLKSLVSPFHPELPWGASVSVPVCVPSSSSDSLVPRKVGIREPADGGLGVFLPLPSPWVFSFRVSNL